MNHFLTDNLEFLKMKEPLLADRIEKHIQSNQPVMPVKDAQSRWNLRVGGSEEKPKWLYSDASIAFKDVQDHLKKSQIILLLGLGLGYHLDELGRKLPKTTQFLVIVEPSLTVFCAFLMIGDRRPLLANEKIFWFAGMTDEEVEAKLIGLMQMESFAASSPQYAFVEWNDQSESLERFKGSWSRYHELFSERSDVNFIDSYYGFMNFTDNWDRISKTPLIQEFKGVFKGKPGILVGSGPSLNSSLDFLKEVQDKAVIVAAGSALPLLLKHGIKVSLSSCLERNPTMRPVYENLDTSSTYLVTTPIIHRDTFEVYRGPIIYLGRLHHFLPAVFPDAQFENPFMTSVSHVGFHTLHTLGCDPIYLIGQDLALDPHTKETHAQDYYNPISMDEMMEIVKKKRKVPSNRDDGQTIETWELWYQYALGLVQMVRDAQVPCYNVIPREYGMRIEGTTRLDPDDALKGRFKEAFDAKAILDRADSLFREGSQPRYERQKDDFVRKVVPFLKRVVEECLKIKRMIYDFRISHPSSSERIDNFEDYKQLYMAVDARWATFIDEPLFVHLIKQISFPRLHRGLLQSYALMVEDEQEREVAEQKLALILRWAGEVSMRSEMALRRLRMLRGLKEGA